MGRYFCDPLLVLADDLDGNPTLFHSAECGQNHSMPFRSGKQKTGHLVFAFLFLELHDDVIIPGGLAGLERSGLNAFQITAEGQSQSNGGRLNVGQDGPSWPDADFRLGIPHRCIRRQHAGDFPGHPKTGQSQLVQLPQVLAGDFHFHRRALPTDERCLTDHNTGIGKILQPVIDDIHQFVNRLFPLRALRKHQQHLAKINALAGLSQHRFRLANGRKNVFQLGNVFQAILGFLNFGSCGCQIVISRELQADIDFSAVGFGEEARPQFPGHPERVHQHTDDGQQNQRPNDGMMLGEPEKLAVNGNIGRQDAVERLGKTT